MAGKDLFAPASETKAEKAKGKDLFASPASASPFLQKGMNMTQGAMATPPTGKEAALDARNAQIRERQDLLGKANKAIKDVQDIQRRRRVDPVDAAAGEAGRAETLQQLQGMSPFVAGMGGANAAQIAGDARSEQVYDRAGVMSAPKATDLRTINSIAAGIPGIVNKDFRGDLAQAGEDQPGAALLGDIQGFFAPGMAAWDVGRAGVNALARPFIPRGADALSRGTRYTAPLAGQVTGAAAQNAAFQAGVQEPIRAEQSGENLTLGGMGAAAMRGLTDPINALPAVASGINRTWNALTSGIATPSTRAAQMANEFGVGPRQTAASQGIAQTTRQLGGQIQPGDIAGFANIENMLRFALRDNRNIPDVNARIATGFERIRQSLPLEDDPTLNLARLIEREFSEDAPQTRDIIRRFLLKVGMDSPGGGQIVGDAANAIRGQQTDVLRTEVESAFGAQPRVEADAAIRGSLDQFSQAYNTVLRGAPTTGPQVDRARALLAREPQSMAILDDVAQSRNMTPEQLIERAPLEALHLVQSELASQARAMAARGDAGAGPLEITVRNMQRPLREGVQGYGELQGLWRQWTQARERMGYVRGAEAGTAGELTTVPGFGDKVLGAGGVRSSEMGTQAAADVFLQMDELSQRAAGLSVRDVISDELRKMRAAGVDQRYAAPARMAQVATEGGLDALRRVFGEAGDRVARRIEQFIDATEFSRNIDPEFNSATMNKGQAMQTGAQPFAGPLGQRAQAADSALSQSALADAALLMTGAPPILSIMRAPGIAARSLQPSQRTQQNIASTLLRRGQIGSQVPPLPGGPPPIMPIDPASVPGGQRTVGRNASAATPANALSALRNNEAGSIRTDVATTLAGGAAGYQAGEGLDLNGDGKINWEDRVAGVMYGVGGKYAAKAGLKRVWDGIGSPPTGRTGRGPMGISKGGIIPEERGYKRIPTPEESTNNRWEQTKATIAIDARRAGETLTPEQLQQRAADDYRAVYKKEPPGVKSDGTLEAQGWQRALDDAYETLRSERGEGNFTAYDLEQMAISDFTSYYGPKFLPKDSLNQADRLVPGTADPSDLVPPTRTSGIVGRGDLGNALAGAGLGGIAPADSNEERLRNMAIGAGIGGASRTVGRLAGAQGDDVARTAGTPKTAAQAAKFETPGSPEYEAAVAKGLDMSTPARKARAKAAGYNTDRVWYHGTRKDFDAFDTSKSTDGLGIHVGTVDQAEGFARSTKALSMKNPDEFKSNRQILPLYVRANNSIRLPDMQDWEPNRVVRALRRKGIEVQGSGYQGTATAKDIVSALKREGYDSIVYSNKFEADASGKDSLIIFDPSNIRSVNAAFDPDKAASPILTAGAGGGRKPPKPDSPEAIKAAVRDIAKPKPEPTRLEQMVEAGKDASVPPINTMPRQADALGAQAERMVARGLSPIEIYDQTGVAMIPYNGGNVPIVSPKMGPEELTRVFYSWLKEPPAKRPDWVQKIVDQAPRKKGLLLTERERIAAPPQANALAQQPLPPERFPVGAAALGAGAGILTGVPAGIVGGTLMAREQERKRNALAQ